MADEQRRLLPNRAARRRNVLEALASAAADLTHGADSFAGLGVERLSRRAGISRASFYLYFEDKGDLVRGWLETFDEEADRLLDNWFRSTAPSHHDIADIFEHLETLHRANRFILSAAEEMTAHDLTLRHEREAAHQRHRAALHRHITRGQRDGWIDANLAGAATADWLIAMVDRVQQHVVPKGVDNSPIFTTGADVVWRTLYSLPDR